MAITSEMSGRSRPMSIRGSRLTPGLRRVMLLVPVTVLVALFFVWPILNVLLRSLDPAGEVHWGSPSVSGVHYSEVMTDGTLRGVITHTFVVAIWATVLTAALAFPVAYLMSRLSRRAGLVLLTLILLPFWLSILVRLFAFTQILGREGLINSVAGDIGLGPFSLLFNTTSTVVGMVAYLVPYMLLILYAGMSGIDNSMVTAAKTLGASPGQAFRRVYFPLVRPSLITGILLTFVLSLGFFLTPAVLGGPGDTTIPIYIQQQINRYQWGTASAIGMLLLVVTIIGYAGAIRLGGIGAVVPGGGSSGKGTVDREPLRFTPITVGLWLITGVVLIVLLAPLVVVIPESFNSGSRLSWPPQGFSTQWYSEVLENPIWTDSIAKSAVVAAGTALLSTLAGLVLARVIVGLRSRTARSMLQSVVYAPLIVPVILLAIGIYDVEARLKLLGTTHGLVLAHAVIAFPLAFAVLSNALSNVDPAIEPAAWTLGASRRRAFWSTVMPNIVPSLIGALLITFVTSWDEAVIALFQTGLDKTLPVTIFSFLESGVTPAVAAVATMLVGLVVLCVLASVVFGSRRARQRRTLPTRREALPSTAVGGAGDRL